MTLRIGQTRLRIHALTLLFPLVATALGAGQEVLALTVALAVHEGAHILAARALGIPITQLQLMPFGGAIVMENPYALPAGRLLLTAAAGPAGNLLALLASAALAHWGWLSPGTALAFSGANLLLMLFNLLPALPLDGGRILYAALFPRIGRARAANCGLWAGRIVSALLFTVTVFSWINTGRLNLSPVFAAIFILSSAARERESLSGLRVETMLSELKPLRQPVPARLVAVGGDCGAQAALRLARPDALTLYAVYDGSRLASFTDDRRLLKAMLERGVNARVLECV